MAQGHSETDLDELGLAQSRTLIKAFSGLDVARVLSSDLRRCIQTAERVAEGCHVEIETLKILRERSFGVWEGTQYERVRESLDEEAVQIGKPVFAVRPEGGESMEDVWMRLDSLVDRLLDTQSDLAVVSHGGTIGLLIARLIDAGPEAARNIRINNCSISELHRRADGGWSLVRVNDCRHMEGLDEGVIVGA